jgi:hypothetical protein
VARGIQVEAAGTIQCLRGAQRGVVAVIEDRLLRVQAPRCAARGAIALAVAIGVAAIGQVVADRAVHLRQQHRPRLHRPLGGRWRGWIRRAAYCGSLLRAFV